MMRERDIANATLREVKPGMQGFDLDRNVHGFPSLWLTGYTCNRNAVPGDSGKIVYVTAPSSGLFYFRKGESVEGNGHIDGAEVTP